MWADIDTDDDLLNFTVIAKTVAEMVFASTNEAMSIGVSGDWGVGKSSLVKMISKEIESKNSNSAVKKYTIIHFNAWLYQGYEDAKIALLQKVYDELNSKYSSDKNVGGKIRSLFAKINWLKGLKWVTSATSLVVPALENTAPAISGLAPVLANMASAIPDSEKVEVDASSTLKGIEELRNDFSYIINQLNLKIVIVIDDLDRCLPDTAISTLEAMRLILFLPNTVYIIAADQQMIKNAVKLRFNMSDQSDNYAINYFDKLIQIPIQVPFLGVNEVKVYIFLLLMEELFRDEGMKKEIFNSGKSKILDLLNNSWKNPITVESMSVAFDSEKSYPYAKISDQLANVMMSSDEIIGNPRLIKRFLNNLWIKRSIAKKQHITAHIDVLAKLQLFERYANKKTFEFFSTEIAKNDGKVKLIKDYEDNPSAEFKFPENFLDTPFLRHWLSMEPKLGDVDLRPAFYLTKDSPIKFFTSNELSEAGRRLFLALRLSKGGSINQIVKKDLQSIGPLEAEKILDNFRRILGENDESYSLIPEQAYPILEVYPNLWNGYIEMIKAIPFEKLKPKIPILLKDNQLGISFMEEILSNSSINKHTKKAIELALKG